MRKILRRGDEVRFRASVETGVISSPPYGSGIYCARLPVSHRDHGPRWARGAFYVGLASDFISRLTYMHHRWYQIRDARAVFAIVHEPGPAKMHEALRELEGAVERTLAKRIDTVNEAATYIRWSPEIGATATDVVNACVALHAEVA